MVDKLKIFRKVLFRKPWCNLTEITFLEVSGRLVGAGEETSSKWRVCDYSDPQLSTGLKEANIGVFDIQRERAIFSLHSIDMMDFARPAKSIRRHLAEAQVLDFTLTKSRSITVLAKRRLNENKLLQLQHSLNRLLNRRFPINAVAVV